MSAVWFHADLAAYKRVHQHVPVTQTVSSNSKQETQKPQRPVLFSRERKVEKRLLGLFVVVRRGSRLMKTSIEKMQVMLHESLRCG